MCGHSKSITTKVLHIASTSRNTRELCAFDTPPYTYPLTVLQLISAVYSWVRSMGRLLLKHPLRDLECLRFGHSNASYSYYKYNYAYALCSSALCVCACVDALIIINSVSLLSGLGRRRVWICECVCLKWRRHRRRMSAPTELNKMLLHIASSTSTPRCSCWKSQRKYAMHIPRKRVWLPCMYCVYYVLCCTLNCWYRRNDG